MRQIKEIQNRLNTAQWTAEYAHPHKWSDRDMDNCLYRIEKTRFSVKQVTDAVSENLDDIIQLMIDWNNDPPDRDKKGSR